MAQIVTRTFDDLRAESHRGEIVYVTDQAGTTSEGPRREDLGDVDRPARERQAREWAASEVAWITQRRGHAGRGALIGLAFGAVSGVLSSSRTANAGITAMRAVGVMMRRTRCFSRPFFGGIGAGAGAAIGAAIRPERVLYAAPSPPSAHVFELRVAPGVIGLRAQLRF